MKNPECVSKTFPDYFQRLGDFGGGCNSDIDEKYMSLAWNWQRRDVEKVEPNPMVGAVLVKNGEIIGKGYHRVFGGHHAEIHAINEAGVNCKGATLYVSMEPMCAPMEKQRLVPMLLLKQAS